MIYTDVRDDGRMVRSLPWWMWPARLIARLHSGVGVAIVQDAALLSRLRLDRWLPWAVVVIGVFLALARVNIVTFLSPPPPFLVYYIYTESVLFMSMALLIGFLAPTLGVLFIAVYGILDLVVVRQLPLAALAGRWVATWLLWLLIVEVPLANRALARATAARLRRRAGELAATLAGAAVGALMAGGLVWIWAQATAILIRPVFTWDRQDPITRAIAPLQQENRVLVVLAVILAFGASALYARLGALDEEEGLGQSAPPTGRARRIWRAASVVLLLFALGGMISGPLDVAILLAALLGAEPLARSMMRLKPVRALVDALPLAVRFVLGFALTLIVANVITSLPADNRPSEFFPIVVTTAVGVLIYVLLLSPRRAPVSFEDQPRAIGTTLKILIGILGAALLLVTPESARADNCSGYFDCVEAAASAAAAAAAAAAVAGGLVGQSIGARQKKKDCSGLQRGYEQAKAFLDTLDAQIDQVAQNYNSNYDKLQDLATQATRVKDEAMSELARIAALEGLTLGVSAIVEIISSMLIKATTVGPIDPISRYIYAGGPSGSPGIAVPPVGFYSEAAAKFYEFYDFWNSQAEGLNVDAYRELANEWRHAINVDALEKMLDLIDQMNSVIARMNVLMNKYDELLVERAELQKNVAEAKAAWEDCLRENW